MSVKRKDKRGRILRDGETQCRDGRYRFSYYENGKQKSFYSWRLEETDSQPKGTRKAPALRTKEKDYRKSADNGSSYSASSMTVAALVDRYINQHQRTVRCSTRKGYRTMQVVLKEDAFGSKSIGKIRNSDAKDWFISLQNNGRAYRTIHNYHGVLRPAFQSAIDDEILVRNPFDFKLSTILADDSVKRQPLKKEEEEKFLAFVKSHPYYSQYYEGVYILLKTGLRISEFCGLTADEIDLEKGTLRIDHQLQYDTHEGYFIGPTKTARGERLLPMSDEVAECFRIIMSKKRPDNEPVIDGKSGFFYFDINGMPLTNGNWCGYFNRMVKAYNKSHDTPLPKLTPHVCRHTYCTRMAMTGMNPKVLQYLMGHNDISITLETYTHIGFDDVQSEISKLFSKES